MSHAGLSYALMRNNSISSVVAITVRKSHGQMCATGHIRIMMKHTNAKSMEPKADVALATPTIKSFQRLGISSEM